MDPSVRHVLSTVLVLAMDEEDEVDEEDYDMASLMAMIALQTLPSTSAVKPYFSTSCMQDACSLNELVSRMDSDACEAYTRLSLGAFEQLHGAMLPHWNRSMSPSKQQAGHIQKRILSSRASLALTLRYLAAGPDLLDMAILASGSTSFVSRNITFGLDCLLRALRDTPEARVGIPSAEYMQKVGDIVGNSEGWLIMRGCAFVIDGSIHDLERDAKAQVNIFNDDKHPDYNGWKKRQARKGLYIWCLDGTFCWFLCNAPGSWPDGLMFDRVRQEFIDYLPRGVWMLGDSAFPRIPGKVERKMKEDEQWPANPLYATFQQGLEELSTRARMSAEWGVGSLKKVWRIFNKKLPSDNDVLNQRIWMATMMLHNFRVRVMRIGQMSTVFMPDDHDYCW